ncbi:MAG: zinc-binding dehydrogenase [Pseudomonadota bacterium]
MKAIVMTAPGGPEVLEYRELPEPQITARDQIKVRLRAAGVNPVDTKVRAKGLFQGEPPAILGCDGAGEVVAVGDGVSAFGPGDKLWHCDGGLGGGPGGTGGNYAEYRVLDARRARPMPATLDFAHAAAAPLVLITAWESLVTQCRVGPQHTVLVHAGAGGVGHVAVQLAKLHGARVIATVGSAEKAEFVRHLGADQVINYREEDFVARTLELTGGRGADVVYDTVGPEVFRASVEATACYGNLVTLLDPGPDLELKTARTRNLGIHFTLMLAPWLLGLEEHWARQVDILDRCAEWIDGGRLRIHVGASFPLEQAADAHRLVEAGHMQGKAVLTMS